MSIEHCADCKSVNVRPHCPSPKCPWVRCDACKSVTGFAYGELRFVPGPGRG